MAHKDLIKAVAYLRTSNKDKDKSKDKDSERRQRLAIENFARTAGFKIVESYYDEAVSGADPIDARPGFRALLDRLLGNGVRTILVETASRFARDLIVQETGYALLKGRGIELIAADSPAGFLDDTPSAVLIRQILGAVSQFDKAMMVSRMRGARDRKRALGQRAEGPKPYAMVKPAMVALAKKLHRYPINGHRRSLRDVARALADAGYVTSSGKPYSATSIQRMIES